MMKRRRPDRYASAKLIIGGDIDSSSELMIVYPNTRHWVRNRRIGYETRRLNTLSCQICLERQDGKRNRLDFSTLTSDGRRDLVSSGKFPETFFRCRKHPFNIQLVVCCRDHDSLHTVRMEVYPSLQH